MTSFQFARPASETRGFSRQRESYTEIKADINSTMKVKDYGKQSVEEIMRLLAARDAGGGSPGPAEQPAAGAPRGTPT
jgi:hypothetical protein